MMEKVMKKLCGSTGESLAETLIAVLIIAVALTMLASMITATSSLIKKSEDTMDRYYTESEKLETFSAPGSESDPKVTFTVTSVSDPSLRIGDVPVQYAENTIFSKYPVIAYRSEPST